MFRAEVIPIGLIGKGKLLGRSFHVKLWPTLIFLKDGQELERLVRPENAGLIEEALRKIIVKPV